MGLYLMTTRSNQDAMLHSGLSLFRRWMGDVAVTSVKEKEGPAGLETEFEDSMVGIFGERNGLTLPIKVWIDGKPVPPPKAKEGDYLWWLDTSRFTPPKKGSGNLFLWQTLASDLSGGKHTLRIESICSAGRKAP